MLAGTLVVLLAPKVAGVVARLWSERHSVAGKLRVVGKAVLETLASTLIAPVMMVVHVRGLIEIFAGQDSGWSAQRREATALSLHDAVRFHAVHVTIGALLTAAALSVSLHAAMFMTPVLAGLLLSPLVTWLGAKKLRQ